MKTVGRSHSGREAEAGQALVLLALMMMALLFAVGLAIDAGQLFVAKRTEQEAADAGAFAGAVVLYQGGTPAAAIAAATADTQLNGYANGVNQTTVIVNSPPTSGPYNGVVTYVEVIVTRQVQTVLVPAEAAFNPVRARGVAGAEPLNNGYAIMALDRGNTPSAFTDQSQADIHLTGGGILVNSSSATAAVNAQTAPRFTIAAPYGVDINGNTSSSWPAGMPINTAVPQKPDPFAGFPKPTVAAPVCATLASCQNGLGHQLPGIYQVSLGGAGGTTLLLEPGIYVLERGINEAGNADIKSVNDATCQGPPNVCGVFIYNTLTGYPASTGTCSGITLAGNAVSTLLPQTFGTYANFLLYQDPACAAGMTISGNGTFNGSGTIYLPSAQFTFNGNNATLTGSQLIAKDVNIQNGNITIDFNAGATAQPILPRLAE